MKRNSAGAKLLPVLGTILPIPILRSTGAGSGDDELPKQAARIRELAAHGFPVPPIRYVDTDFLVLEDCGPVYERAIRGKNHRGPVVGPGILRRVLLDITRTLAALHAGGFAHGRPKMRDFTWQDGQVTILDLEESPWEVMPMADAQARDIFLWCHDLCSAPLSREVLPDALAVMSDTMTDETRDSLRRLLRVLRIASIPAHLVFRAMPNNRELSAGLAAYDALLPIAQPQ